MKKYLSVILLKTFIFSTVISMAGTAILMGFHTERNRSDLQNLVYGVALYMDLVLSLSALTIYLNLIPTIRNSIIYSALSFFALPVICAVLSLIELGEVKDQFDAYSIMILPFFLVLGFYFTKFLKIK